MLVGMVKDHAHRPFPQFGRVSGSFRHRLHPLSERASRKPGTIHLEELGLKIARAGYTGPLKNKGAATLAAGKLVGGRAAIPKVFKTCGGDMSDPAIDELHFPLYPVQCGELELADERSHPPFAVCIDRHGGVTIPGSAWSVAKIKREGK